jgi:hypothetical protein
MMRHILALSLTAALNAAPPQAASIGCVRTTTVTVESESCLQLECVEQGSNGTCTRRECVKTQKKKYMDASSTGCSRMVNCGRSAYFSGGTPEEPETESTETCDWRACVENDAETGTCTSYQCLSRRTIHSESVTYAEARCIKNAAYAAPLPQEQGEATQPFAIKPVRVRKALQDIKE